MTQTEPNTAEQAEQAHRFPIHDDYDAHPGSSFDYLTEQRDRLKSAEQDLQLVTLKEAATEDGDEDLAEMCDQALEGDPAAREACEIALVILQARDQGTVGESTEEVARRLAEFRAAYLEAMKAYASSPDAPADLWEVGD